MGDRINKSTVAYMLALFVMPILCVLEIIIVNNDAFAGGGLEDISIFSYETLITIEVVLFLACWISLFISYIMHMFNRRRGKAFIIFLSGVLLINYIVYSAKVFESTIDVIYPILVLLPTLFSMFNPLSEEVVANRKKRIKNTIKKK